MVAHDGRRTRRGDAAELRPGAVPAAEDLAVRGVALHRRGSERERPDVHVGGDDVGLLSEPRPETTIHQPGGWDLDGLDATAPSSLTAGLKNPYTLDAYPELKVFEE